MNRYVAVRGTGEATRKHNRWTRLDSDFAQHQRTQGWEPIDVGRGFWSTTLVAFFRGPAPWRFGGKLLYDFLWTLPLKDRVIWAHSWGGAVAAYALSMRPRVPIRALVTVGTPQIRSLDKVWRKVHSKDSDNVRPVPLHIHVYGTGWGARIRLFAQFRSVRFRREMPWAHENVGVQGGHSGMFRVAKHMAQADQVNRLIEERG